MTYEEIKKEYFGEDEEIIWQGTADKLTYFMRADVAIIPLTLIISGFLLFSAYASFMMMMQGKSMSFALSGITVLLVAFYLLFGRIWYRHKRIQRNMYFVTDRRVFALNTLRNTVIVDLPIDMVFPEIVGNTLYLREKNLFGDVVHHLGLDVFFHGFVSQSPAFTAISDPDLVVKKMKQTAKKRKKVQHDTEDFI